MTKQLTAILFSILILLSGLNIRVVSHFCGQEYIETICSVRPVKSGCCAGESTPSSSTHIEEQPCCQFFSNTLKVDPLYKPSSFELKKTSTGKALISYIPTWGFLTPKFKPTPTVNYYPPGLWNVTDVSRQKICVYLI